MSDGFVGQSITSESDKTKAKQNSWSMLIIVKTLGGGAGITCKMSRYFADEYQEQYQETERRKLMVKYTVRLKQTVYPTMDTLDTLVIPPPKIQFLVWAEFTAK